MIASAEYSLYSDDMLRTIKKDRDSFIKCVTGNYIAIADEYGFNACLSKSRLINAHVFWCDDLERLKKDGSVAEPTEELDHFKHAAFLTFWLRRFHPLEKIDINSLDASDPVVRSLHSWFSLYGNEICALSMGIKICTAFTIAEIASRSDVHLLLSKDELLRNTIISPRFEADAIMMLKHKNNSPHSIYLIFKALYSGLLRR